MNVFLNSTNHNFVIYFSNIYSTEIIKNLANPRLEAMIVVGAVKTFVSSSDYRKGVLLVVTLILLRDAFVYRSVGLIVVCGNAVIAGHFMDDVGSEARGWTGVRLDQEVS